MDDVKSDRNVSVSSSLRRVGLTPEGDKKSLKSRPSSKSSRVELTPSKSPSQKSRSPSKNNSRTESNKSAKLVRSVSRKKSGRSNKTSKSSKVETGPISTAEYDDLSGQGFTTLNHKIFQKTTLKTLILSSNNLHNIPVEIASLCNLEYLDICKNPFRAKDAEDVSSLPIELRLLTNLKFLSISECNLRHIPMSIWLCVSLERLDLSRNKISLLVPDVGNLQNLESINIAQCNLTTLPSEIGFCFELREILLMANQIESLPDTLKDCKFLETLRVSYRHFSSLLDTYMENLIHKGQIKSEHIPLVVFELQKLKSIDLQHTKINTLPDNNLKSIENMYLDHNYIMNFTERVFNSMIGNLKILTLSRNLLVEIPSEINSLINLEILNLSHNAITNITNITRLVNLKEFYLNNNKITEANTNLKHLKNLRRLSLASNEINTIADSLYSLNYLNYLDFTDNKLTEISPNICNLKAIRNAHMYEKSDRVGLWLLNNPLKTPSKDIWQTTNIKKIYDNLSSHVQRNLDCVFYSKLVFLGESGVGKSHLIDKMFDVTESSDINGLKTNLARKRFKRTGNKVEWFFIDLGGDPVYSKVHSTFFSSIDLENEPTIFVLVYNHKDYTSENHWLHLGSWIESILIHTNPCSKKPIQMKLIGIVDDNLRETEAENEAKINTIINDCNQTVISHRESLLKEKDELEASFKSNPESHTKRAIELINKLLKQRVYFNGDILVVKDSYQKEETLSVLSALEDITISMNNTMPIDLNIKLKKHLVKLMKTYKTGITYEKLTESIQKGTELEDFLKKHKKLSTSMLINYSKTMGDIFWLKNHNTLGNSIFLQLDYILKILKILIRHDLSYEFIHENKQFFKSLGLTESDSEFEEMVLRASRSGMFENNIVTGLCFMRDVFEQTIKKDMNWLQEVALIYISESQDKNHKCSYYNVILPDMNSNSFTEERNSNPTLALFSDQFEQYFVFLEKFDRYRSLLKTQNILKKREKTFEYELEDNLKKENEQSEEQIASLERINQIEIMNINRLEDSEFLESFLSNKKHITDKIDEEEDKSYEYVTKIEYYSVFHFKNHIFSRLSILLNNLFHLRYDWSDTIIARDSQFNCFKVQFFNNTNERSLIRVIIKSLDEDSSENIVEEILELFEDLFSYYPGLYYKRSIYNEDQSLSDKNW